MAAKLHKFFSTSLYTLHKASSHHLQSKYITFSLHLQITQKPRKYVIFSPSQIYIRFTLHLQSKYIFIVRKLKMSFDFSSQNLPINPLLKTGLQNAMIYSGGDPA